MNVKYDDSMKVAMNIIREHAEILGYLPDKMNDEKVFNHIEKHSPKKAAILLEIADKIRKLNIL